MSQAYNPNSRQGQYYPQDANFRNVEIFEDLVIEGDLEVTDLQVDGKAIIGNELKNISSAAQLQVDTEGTTRKELVETNYSGGIVSSDPILRFRGSRGVKAVPVQTSNNDLILDIRAVGMNNAGAFASAGCSIQGYTTENVTTTANGSLLSFWTCGNGSTTESKRMTIYNTGQVLVGALSTPLSNYNLSLQQSTSVSSGFVIDNYSSGALSGNSTVLFRSARGTNSVPTAVQSGDSLGILSARGYAATGFSTSGSTIIQSLAAENWSDTAWGAHLDIGTIPLLSTTNTRRMRITSEGNILVGSNLTTPVQGDSTRNYISIEGKTAGGVLETSSVAADADGTINGILQFSDQKSINVDKRTGLILSQIRGTTATDRGGSLTFQTKVDGGALISAFHINNQQLIGCGITTPLSKLNVNYSTFTTKNLGFYQSGTFTGVNDNGIKALEYTDAIIQPNFAGNISTCMTKWIAPNFQPQAGCTIDVAASLYLSSGTSGGAGTVTQGYTLFCETPAFGVSKLAVRCNGEMKIYNIAGTTLNMEIPDSGLVSLPLGATTPNTRGITYSGTNTVTGAAPVTLNSKVGLVNFTGVPDIAAGAGLTLLIQNNLIGASSLGSVSLCGQTVAANSLVVIETVAFINGSGIEVRFHNPTAAGTGAGGVMSVSFILFS